MTIICKKKLIIIVVKKITNIFQNSQNWHVILFSAFVYVPLPFLAAYWGTSFLQAKNFDHSIAAFIISMLWFGYAIGSPLIGRISDKVNK